MLHVTVDQYFAKNNSRRCKVVIFHKQSLAYLTGFEYFLLFILRNKQFSFARIAALTSDFKVDVGVGAGSRFASGKHRNVIGTY